MMVSWLFNSIDPVLQPSITYFVTTKKLWDDLKSVSLLVMHHVYTN
jgi:hypothetical protein